VLFFVDSERNVLALLACPAVETVEDQDSLGNPLLIHDLKIPCVTGVVNPLGESFLRGGGVGYSFRIKDLAPVTHP